MTDPSAIRKPGPDVKKIREEILYSIRERLRKVEGGEGGNIKSMQLFITCNDADRPAYEAALYYHEPGKFRNTEIQRLADDYAVALPENWELEIVFEPELPKGVTPINGIDAGLFIATKKHSIPKTAVAFLKIRGGKAEQPEYRISSESSRICIGREKQVQTADGFFRKNDIAFVGEDNSNRFISRQHAHIEFDQDSGCFVLYADEGGIPPRNKVKVRSTGDGGPVKLYSTGIGHRLKEGDQILLGDSALIEFSYLQGID